MPPRPKAPPSSDSSSAKSIKSVKAGKQKNKALPFGSFFGGYTPVPVKQNIKKPETPAKTPAVNRPSASLVTLDIIRPTEPPTLSHQLDQMSFEEFQTMATSEPPIPELRMLPKEELLFPAPPRSLPPQPSPPLSPPLSLSSSLDRSSSSFSSSLERPPSMVLPLTPPESVRSGTPTSSLDQYPSPPRRLALQVTTEAPISDVPRETQKVFDQTTKMLARALGLQLCYIAQINLASTTPTLRILASFGLQSGSKGDPMLHLKALRAVEGGILYQNPKTAEERQAEGNAGYVWGILMSVLEVRRAGYVLCGYSADETRGVGEDDLLYFTRFAEQLEVHVTKVGRPQA